MDHTNRFDGKGELYAKARPKYAAELFAYLKNSLNIRQDSIFADIGSGTGIFTEQLLHCGYKVFAVEPNGDMRRKAEEKLSGNSRFTSVGGADRDTGLPEQSVDHIVTAQAFHWFDVDAFKKECRRILKPNGTVMIVYNTREESAACNKALADLHRRYCPQFEGFSKGMNEEKCRAFFDGRCEIFRADNSLTYDRGGYVSRVLSSSYSLREGDENYAEYLEEINKLFDMFAIDGAITVPMFTVAYIGSIKEGRERMRLSIKKCTADDLEILRQLSIKTYYETFAHLNTPEDMAAYLMDAFNEDKLCRELGDQNSTFFFLYADEKLAGYLKWNEAPSQTDINDRESLEIERIYVSSGFQGAGLGKYLMEKAISIATERGKKYVWLGVWEKNEKAICFYKKNGFYEIGTHAFVMGEDVQTDYIMRKDL